MQIQVVDLILLRRSLACVEHHLQWFYITVSILTRLLMNVRTDGLSLSTGLKLFSCQGGQIIHPLTAM